VLLLKKHIALLGFFKDKLIYWFVADVLEGKFTSHHGGLLLLG
jgi:hypothetical protein